jgi:DNA-binding response OmpR family regulator
VCNSVEFLNWLQEFGGDSPREWLRFAAPLIAEYRKRGKRLTAAETHEFIQKHPAPLRLHRERREIWLGQKCIPIGSVAEFRVLEYLANRPGKISSLEELYYYAQAEMNTVPEKGESKWVPKETWRGAMDTLIWRLRHKVEKNAREPLYLITHHGKGLELLYAEE